MSIAAYKKSSEVLDDNIKRRANRRHEMRVMLVTSMVSGRTGLSEGLEVGEANGLIRAADAIIDALEARYAAEHRGE